jgi:nucleotidyltransferase/DNA polymerase involved in DNA repair
MNKKYRTKNELRSLCNVGPATQKDLALLGITRIEQLTHADPDELYERLQLITGHRHDPCVWDVFAAIIHEANTGEKRPWWHWTQLRKARK